MAADQQILEALVQRVVDTAHPLRVVLFGSTARGDAGPESDLDILVIMPDGVHRRKTAQRIHRQLWGLGCAKDIIVVTEGDVREHGMNPNMVIYHALREGKELYLASG